MRQDKDRASHWFVEHFGDIAVRLIGVKNVAAARALKGDVVAPRRFPDGLIEVTFTDRPDKAQYLIEVETYADPDADRQMFEDLMTLAVDHRPLPTGIILVLRPKGNAEVKGSYAIRSRDGITRLGGNWNVVEVWRLRAEDLLAENDVGLIPWVPLASYGGPPEELLRECRARIDRDAPKERHEGLLAVTSIMAAAVYDKALVRRLILGDAKMSTDLMEFLGIRELVAEQAEKVAAEKAERMVAERGEKSRAEARRSTAVDYIAGILKARFQSVPDDLRTRLDAIVDESRLAALRDVAVTCPDLEAFRVALAGS